MAHLTLENVILLASKIEAKYGLANKDAMDLAELNLRYASSYEEALSRV